MVVGVVVVVVVLLSSAAVVAAAAVAAITITAAAVTAVATSAAAVATAGVGVGVGAVVAAAVASVVASAAVAAVAAAVAAVVAGVVATAAAACETFNLRPVNKRPSTSCPKERGHCSPPPPPLSTFFKHVTIGLFRAEYVTCDVCMLALRHKDDANADTDPNAPSVNAEGTDTRGGPRRMPPLPLEKFLNPLCV